MNKRDITLAEEAEKETEAQLAIILLLKPLERHKRASVMQAAKALILADQYVSGVIEKFLQGKVVS